MLRRLPGGVADLPPFFVPPAMLLLPSCFGHLKDFTGGPVLNWNILPCSPSRGQVNALLPVLEDKPWKQRVLILLGSGDLEKCPCLSLAFLRNDCAARWRVIFAWTRRVGNVVMT